jgi:N-carbamoylputrescine amidase
MVKVAAIQVSTSQDPDRSLKKAAEYLKAAAQRGAEIACFPEMFGLPWFPQETREDSSALAQPVDGPWVSAICRLAQDAGVAVICPFFERDGDGVYHNSAVVVDSGGRKVGLYRKVHLPHIPHWREKDHFYPGDLGFPVIEVGGVRLGVQIGWDNFFPEGFRCLALAGAQLVFVPTAAAFASRERWLAMAVSHAVANGMFVLRVNRVGSEAGLDFYGNSFAVRPDGELCSEPMGMKEGVLVVGCDLAEVERARRAWPFLKDRRPRQYARVAGIEWGPDLLPTDGAEQGAGVPGGMDRGPSEPPPDGVHATADGPNRASETELP